MRIYALHPDSFMSRVDIFNKKKVLLVCAETFSWPMHYIAEKIRPHCESLSAIFIQPAESFFAQPDFTLFKSLNKDINIYDMSQVSSKYLSLSKNVEAHLDHEYIKYIESKFTTFSSLNEQFLAEMTFLPYYHDRGQYGYLEYKKILLYAQIYYQYIEELFKKNKPDIILDTDVDFFGRSVLLEVSNYYDVPYISIDHTRLDGYVLPTATLVKKRDPKIESLFYQLVADGTLLTDEAKENKYSDLLKPIGDVPKVFEKMKSDHVFSVRKLLKRFVIQIIVSLKYFSVKKLKINIINRVSSPICSSVLKSYKFMFLYYFRRFFLHYSNIFSKADLKKINYIYVPMHVIPESSTTILSPYYINETFIIESLSKSVRSDQYVVVKEHWSMIGYRPINYYKRIKRLPNVILVDPASQLLPRDYIRNSDLVVTISGSAAFEASVLGVNSLIFSDVIYGLLSGCKKVHVDSNLGKLVAEQIGYKMPKRELYAYIEICLKFGKKVQIKNLLAPPSRTDKNTINQDVKNLLEVFMNGLEVYEQNNSLQNAI